MANRRMTLALALPMYSLLRDETKTFPAGTRGHAIRNDNGSYRVTIVDPDNRAAYDATVGLLAIYLAPLTSNA